MTTIRNHYNFLNDIVKKSYEGTLAKEIVEDPTFAIALGQTAKIGFQQGDINYDAKQKKVFYNVIHKTNLRMSQGNERHRTMKVAE